MSAVYDFRCNEDMYDSEELMAWLILYCKKWVFQLEEGDTGYRHWQGRFSLMKKRTKDTLMKLFKGKVPNYLKPTATENHLDEYFYAMKEDTRIGETFSDKKRKLDQIQAEQHYVPRQFRNIELYPWQQRIKEMSDVFDTRTIHMVYDPHGNKGKSTVAAIMEILHGGIDMPPLNDFKDLIALACNMCMDSNLRNPKVFFFDMPRALDKSKLYGLYSAIEQIKKGKLYDIRYHYKCWWIDSPAIWVFSNILPDRNLLSSDRWRLWQIGEDKLLVPFDEFIEEKISPLDQ